MPGPEYRYRFTAAVPPVVLVIALFCVYGQILGHDFISNWDDSAYVTDNPAVQEISWNNIRTILSSYYVGNYAPVQMLSYMVDFSIWGARAGGFLLTNLLVHAASGLLFFRLLLRLHGDRLSAFIGSALFLLHPVQVESVAWISQRKNVLAMLFFLLAWECYCRYRDAEPGRGRFAYAASVASFTLALLSKSVAVIFPVVLILFDVCFSSGITRTRLKDKVPFIISAAAVAGLALVSQQSVHGGGRAAFHGGSPLATFFTMMPVVGQYLKMSVWPTGLSAEYDPVIHQHMNSAVAGAALLLLLTAVACGVLMTRNRRLGFWALLFFVGLLPVSQIIPLVTLINDRYLYFPMLGFAALCGGGSALLLERLEPSWGRAVKVLLAGLLVLLALLSWQRAHVWRDDFTLWSDAVAKYPGKSSIQSAMGDVFLNHNRVDEAWRAYERALQLNPRESIALLNLGTLYSQKGELETGHRMLMQLVMVDPRNFKAWANLGNNYVLQGEYAEAEKAYRRANELQPDDLKVVGLLGNVALLEREPDKARTYFLQVEGKGGNDPETACGLARADAQAGHADAAVRWLVTALERGFNDLDKLKEFSELGEAMRSPAFIEAVRKTGPR